MTQVLAGEFDPVSGAVPPPGEPAARIEGRTPLQLAWERFRKDKVAVGAGLVIAAFVIVAVFAPVFTAIIGHGPNERFADVGVAPDGIPYGPRSGFLLGNDNVGRDILSRIIYGTRISLIVGVVATGLAITIGVSAGLFAGYYGGRTDTVISRVMDVVLSLPFLLVAFVLATILTPSVFVSILVITLFTWVQPGRIVRGQVLSLREKEFVEAARSLGSSDLRIMFVDVLPNLVATIIVYGTLLVPTNIIFESTLSFLGLGVKVPTATWGNMLADAANSGAYLEAWWFLLFPGLALLITVLAFNLLGDGLRDALDPRAARTMAR